MAPAPPPEPAPSGPTGPSVPGPRGPAAPPPGPVSVVGVSGDGVGGLGAAAWRAVTDAEVVFGDRRLLEGAASRLRAGPVGAGTATSTAPELVEVTDREDACRRVAATSGDGRAACLLTRGDPGFFGIVRPLLRVVDRRYLRVVPAPSTVALAFARLGLPWDDAAVVALGVGSLADAVRSIRLARKAAVLTTPGAPPEAVGRALVDARAAVDMVAVCSRMGLEDESVTVIGLDQLATGVWDPHSVVVLLGPAGRPIAGWGGADHRDRPLAWGLPDSAFGLPDGPVPAAEVRAVVLGKLAIPPAGVLWDVGGGSGGVAVEAVSLCPGLTAFAVESEDDAAARITELAVRRGADVKVVHGPIPTACDGLPDPDRVFVGGGGLDVLDAALARLRPGGRVVAAFDALDRATAAADRLGHLVQVSVGRGRPLDDGGWRLGADDPAFVAWGPDPDGPAR